MSLSDRVFKLEQVIHDIKRQLVHTPGKQNEAGIGPQGASNQERDPATRQLPSTLHVTATPKNSQQADDPWYKSIKGWSGIFQIVAVPFAIAYAVVTYAMWSDLRKNFKIDERAWIEARDSDPNFMLSNLKTAGVDMFVTNIGKTPALHVALSTASEILPKAVAPSLSFRANGATTEMGMLFQGEKSRVVVAGSLAPDISEKERLQLTSGEAYLAVWGTATWDDIFGGSHWSRFCFYRSFYNSGSSINARNCTNYNDADSS
ncbi:MAG: hypothetical protein ABI824_10200 [Acidobacteriota bacterium]